MNDRSLASAALVLGGLILMGMGAYFAILRPPILLEDLRFMGTTLKEIEATVPGLLTWLPHVFRVLGGYIFSTGLLTVYIAVDTFKAGQTAAATIMAIAGLTSIGGMALTNFAIDSDFKWLLAAFILPWVFALWFFIRANARSEKIQ